MITFEPGRLLEITRENLTGADFSGVQVEAVYLTECHLVDCDFSGLRVTGDFVASHDVVASRCQFGGLRLSRAQLDHSSFDACVFDRVQIRNLWSFAADISNCVFAGTMRHCVFYGSTPQSFPGDAKRNIFDNNDFRAAVLRDVAFKGGIDLNLQQLPESDKYVRIDGLEGKLARALDRIGGWPSSNRAHAKKKIETLAKYFLPEQDQVLMDRSFFSSTRMPELDGSDIVKMFEELDVGS